MARPSGNTTQIGFDKNILTVTHGQCTASAPADQIDTLIRVLEAARLMVASGGRINLSGPAAAAVAAAATPTGKRRGRPPKNPEGAIRRSRKRVGDALADWLRDNPGWHSTQSLIATVRDNKMTDASPVRAMMIALGKSKGGMFETDGAGHWRLAGDTSGPPPAATPRARKKPGRKPGSGGAKRKAGGGPRGKRAPSGRRGRRSSSADSEGSAELQLELPEATKPIRVKRGESRRDALLSPAELEARRQAATTVDRLRDQWNVQGRSLRERMKKNLFS